MSSSGRLHMGKKGQAAAPEAVEDPTDDEEEREVDAPLPPEAASKILESLDWQVCVMPSTRQRYFYSKTRRQARVQPPYHSILGLEDQTSYHPSWLGSNRCTTSRHGQPPCFLKAHLLSAWICACLCCPLLRGHGLLQCWSASTWRRRAWTEDADVATNLLVRDAPSQLVQGNMVTTQLSEVEAAPGTSTPTDICSISASFQGRLE
eukprot:s4578_g2.t1